jgi:hypothetical protein
VAVWYCAYGSNLDAGRFAEYVRRCRDPSPPRADVPATVGGGLRFERSSARWGRGGVAFLDVDAPGTALCRRWLVTADQFADVVAQENRAEPGTVTVDWDRLAADGAAVAAAGWYGRLVRCGEVDGVPVVTFTATDHVEPSAPSAAYLRVLARGLRDAHGLGPSAVADYLLAAPGVAPAWSRDALMQL